MLSSISESCFVSSSVEWSFCPDVLQRSPRKTTRWRSYHDSWKCSFFIYIKKMPGAFSLWSPCLRTLVKTWGSLQSFKGPSLLSSQSWSPTKEYHREALTHKNIPSGGRIVENTLPPRGRKDERTPHIIQEPFCSLKSTEIFIFLTGSWCFTGSYSRSEREISEHRNA